MGITEETVGREREGERRRDGNEKKENKIGVNT